MSANRLLLWLSFRQAGSWAQFRSAVEELHASESVDGITSEGDENGEPLSGSTLPLHHEMRLVLQRLAHVEFSAEGDWEVTPPAIAVGSTEKTELIGVLCGARTPHLVANLERASEAHVEQAAEPGAPDIVLFRAHGVGSFRSLASRLGLHLQDAAPRTILLSLPAVADMRACKRQGVPGMAGWRISRFSTPELQWCQSSLAEVRESQFDLFRFEFRFQRLYFLCTPSATFSVPVQVGKYAVLHEHRRRVIAYHRESRVLSVPPMCRPPLLVERALILCSGQLPRFNSTTLQLQYTNVSGEIAGLTAAALCQEAP